MTWSKVDDVAVDPQIKQGLEMQLADAQTNIAALEKEENVLSVKDREIQTEFRAQKEASVSICITIYCGRTETMSSS